MEEPGVPVHDRDAGNLEDDVDVLSWIDVGNISAERDELLTHYFYDNGVTERVLSNPSAFLVLGRKGAGKTAVFAILPKIPLNSFRTEMP